MSTVGERESRLLAGLTPPHSGYIAGRFYSTISGPVVTSVAIPAIDTLYLVAFPLWGPVTISSLHMRIQTGGAGSAVKVGLWQNSAVSARPVGAPLAADNTGQDTSGSTAHTTSDITDVTLSPGTYWYGVKATGTLPTTYSIPSGLQWIDYWVGSPSLATSIVGNAISIASTYTDDMPTLAEGASFSELTANGVPVLSFGT